MSLYMETAWTGRKAQISKKNLEIIFSLFSNFGAFLSVHAVFIKSDDDIPKLNPKHWLVNAKQSFFQV